jgi:hypothetical protein
MAFAYLTDRSDMSYDVENAGINRMVGGSPAPRLMDKVRRMLGLKHYAMRTGTVHAAGIRRFILTNGKRPPAKLGDWNRATPDAVGGTENGWHPCGVWHRQRAVRYRRVLGQRFHPHARDDDCYERPSSR